MRTAMLEHGGRGHNEVQQDLTLANVSAWQQFSLKPVHTATSIV